MNRSAVSPTLGGEPQSRLWLLERLWPLDKVILAYFALAVVVILVWWRSLPEAPLLLAFHLAGTALLLAAVRYSGPISWWFRNWYALLYVAFCYKEMQIFIPGVRHGHDADQYLADLDYSFWHANPTVWLERIQTPLLTEYLQVVYTLFVPVVLLVALILWKNRRYADFQYYAFLITLGFLVSYLGYLLVPARGPRFLLRHLQHVPLQGLWFFNAMQGGLDRLESIAYDCFPSGHTELTLLAWWTSRRLGPSLFWPYFAYTSSIIFATVYLRYHYTVDIVGGVLVAVILIVTAPGIYHHLKTEGIRIGGN
jgi:membrane-associated phospholipid phosphatase